LNRTPEPDQVIFMVCDQPFVTPVLLLDLINEQQKSRKPIVASAYAGTLGIPALFDKSLFPQLLDLQGDTGARRIIQQYSGEVASVTFEKGAYDIDTEIQYRELVNPSTG
jgi:molybdenum cofactor cytidylyltransferase